MDNDTKREARINSEEDWKPPSLPPCFDGTAALMAFVVEFRGNSPRKLLTLEGRWVGAEQGCLLYTPLMQRHKRVCSLSFI